MKWVIFGVGFLAAIVALWWSQRMEVFYGRVVDQFGNPVVDVPVEYIPNYDRWSTLQPRLEVRTSADGSFSIGPGNKRRLHVWVKPSSGYYPDNGTRRLDQDGTTVFVLQKMGTTVPLLHRSKSAVFTDEQSFVVGADENARLTIRYWFSPEGKMVSGGTFHDWGVELYVPGGGLLERANSPTNEASSFVAPTSGYQECIRLEYKATMSVTEYRSLINQQYFVRFADGKYARFELRLTSNPTRPFGTVESWCAPAGDRTTEYDPAKELDR